MASSIGAQAPPRSVWVRQAAVRMLWRDDYLGILDAVDLAAAVWQQRPALRSMPPELVVDEIFDGHAEGDESPLVRSLRRRVSVP